MPTPGALAPFESARLAELQSYAILDTQPEQGFDDIVLIAAQICAAPVAMVSLVASDRQWFKARIGADAPETPLSQSICVHSLWQTGMLVIPDLSVDPRTRDNVLVTGAPGIRFYAGAPLRAPSGLVLGALCVIDTDVRPAGLTTAQASALEALARQVMAQAELRKAIATLERRVGEKARERSRIWQISPDLLAVVNADAVLESTNPAWQQLLGWTAAELASRPFFDFLGPDDQARTRNSWARVWASLPALNFENSFRCKDGSHRSIAWVAVLEDGKVYCSGRDLTVGNALQESNAAFESSLRDEQAASALREQFIAVLGHDLRNPLAGVDGGMAMLQRMPLGDRALSIVGMARRSTARMAGLIDNVMDFARGRLGGGLALERGPGTDLDSLLRLVIAELQTTNPDRAILSAIDLPDPIACDPRRIGQLVSNLLGNALAYGAGSQPIHLKARIDGQTMQLSVTNAGTPIPPETLSGLFEPFSRGADRPSRQGLGLGLYISAQIARAHGGTLDVTSDTEATCFVFRMPIEDRASA